MSTKTKLVLASVLFIAGLALQISSYRNTAVAATLGVIVGALLIWAEVGRSSASPTQPKTAGQPAANRGSLPHDR